MKITRGQFIPIILQLITIPILCLVFALFSPSLMAKELASEDASKTLENSEKYTFVIVHGATGGGWDWKTVAQHLTAKGHIVYRPTLTGLGEKYHLASPEISLTTHINDVVNTIIFERLDNIILVGHSYGGMVLTGVMNRIPQRIRHVTFVDAMVPDDGMSMIDVKPLKPSYKVINGMIHFPWLKFDKPYPRDVIQSLKSYTEPVSYINPAAKRLNATYLAFVPKGMSEEKRSRDVSWQRAKERGWTIRTFKGNHVVYRKKPAEFSTVLLETVTDQNIAKY
ncbi:alpha/beta fold hydrolase [uncultured Cocleimonas sp.]|uniref:alpha/beta fold hydrolase n=1 Tax=uncultured Cocleimonas sp. TaxID=1051587 RepID=UPI002632133F|nr:alpha/beta fold hydrolase [uncultured Cocleimonas sp.]